MNNKLTALLGIVVLAALFFGVNFVFGQAVTAKRVDLTEEGLYTLSEGTENILDDLTEEIRLRFYFSESVAAEADGARTARDYAQRVKELLERYEALSNGKITLEVKDPEPFSELEDEAVGYGLRGARVPGGRDQLYFGLAGTNSTDGEEVIPFFDPQRERFLEYDLTQLVYVLDQPELPTVGVLSTLPLRGSQPNPRDPRSQGQQPWMIVQQLEETYDLQWIDRGAKELPEDLDILVLVHPQGLAQSLLYDVDQFVLGGGRVIAFYDPLCEIDTEDLNPNEQLSALSADRGSDLGPLLDAWGVEVPPEQLAADREHALQVSFRGEPMDYVAIFGLTEDSMDSSDPVVADLNEVIFASAGILRPAEDATTTFTPLMRTSEDSMAIQRTSVAMEPNPQQLLEGFAPSGDPLPVVARIGGPAQSAYPDGPPDGAAPENGETEEDDDAPADGHLVGTENVSVLLVSDADLLQDRMWVQVRNLLGQRIAQPISDNANMLLAALDSFSGNDDLISLRSRGLSRRPFTLVEDLREQAEADFREQKQELDRRLEEIQARIDRLQSQQEGAVSGQILTPEQREAIEEAREEQLETRKRLREVQRKLDEDIDALEVRVKFWNFALPGLIALVALGVWAFRRST